MTSALSLQELGCVDGGDLRARPGERRQKVLVTLFRVAIKQGFSIATILPTLFGVLLS
jgi:hypothetical protein